MQPTVDYIQSRFDEYNTRYFGGTLLGTGGLMVAYREASKAALENYG